MLRLRQRVLHATNVCKQVRYISSKFEYKSTIGQGVILASPISRPCLVPSFPRNAQTTSGAIYYRTLSVSAEAERLSSEKKEPIDKALIAKMRKLGGERDWKELNRIINDIDFNELARECLQNAREEQRRRDGSGKQGKGKAFKKNMSAPTSLFTDVLESYMFRPSNANIQKLWSLLEKTRTDPALAENIGIYRLLRIYKICGINSVKGGRRNIRTENDAKGTEKEVYLSSGQAGAMYMHLVEWMASATPDNRRRYMFSLMKTGPDIVHLDATTLVRGVLFAALDTLQYAKGDAEANMVARLVGDLSLTAFHAMRNAGRTEAGIEVLHEALLPLGPHISSAISEDSYSLAVSGCFRPAGETEGPGSRRDPHSDHQDKAESSWKKTKKARRAYTVDEVSLDYLTSLVTQDNSLQSIRLRERLLQVLLSYGQYVRVKRSFESMLSSRAMVYESHGGEQGEGQSSTPLLLGTRAYMALISAHAALRAHTGVLSALELLLMEKRMAEALPQDVKDALGCYTLSGPSSEETRGCLLTTRVKDGVEVGAEKFVYIAAMDTSRQVSPQSDVVSIEGRSTPSSVYDSLTGKGRPQGAEREKGTGKRPLANPRREYQVDMARGLVDRLATDGVKVDTRFLLQVAELGCDDGDFDLCIKVLEAAHTLCQQGVKRPGQGPLFRPHSSLEEGDGGLNSGTSSVQTTQTSRGSITLSTRLEDLPVRENHEGFLSATDSSFSDSSSQWGNDGDSGSGGKEESGKVSPANSSRPTNEELSKIYGYAVLCARKVDRPEDCVMLLYYQLQMGITPTPQSINHVLKALFHAKQHEEVLRIFKLMPRWGVARSPGHAATMIDSLCKMGRLQDAYKGMAHIGPKSGVIRDDSRKGLLKQLCYALVTNGRNDRGNAKFQYDDLLEAIADCTSDLLVSPTMHSPTQRMRLARNFAYFMQGSPDDVLEAVLKRIMLRLTTHGVQETDSMLAWVRKVKSLREGENQKSAMGLGRRTKFQTPPSRGVAGYGEARK